MAIKNLVPWKWGEKKIPVERVETDPAYALRQDVDRWFGDFFSGFDLAPFKGSWPEFNPKLDVVENDQELKVLAELPGLDQNDIQVSLDHNVLTISGERQQETSEETKNFHHVERYYGSFERSFRLPKDVASDAVKAKYDAGLLNIQVPKAEVAKPKEIKIN